MSAARRKERVAARNARNSLSFEPFDPFDNEPVTLTDDEALARALQDEYAEVDRRQQRQVVVQGVAVSASAPPAHMDHTRAPPYVDLAADEEVARRLQVSLREEMKFKETPTTSRCSSEDSAVREAALEEDEALAQKMTQELQDEDLARHITVTESAARATRHRASSQKRGCSCIRFCCYLIPLAAIGASLAAILYYFVFSSEGLPQWAQTPEDFANEDPFRQQDPASTSRWRNRGTGIELNVLNALTEEWFGYFYQAVSDWDNGVPDTLTLKTTRVDADPSCRTVARALKMCNGNYGETSWRGINKLLLEDNNIYASAARMNEFYFGANDQDQRQYTMCHEMGHGFGLPHTDESFTNADKGNCMDYTNRPRNNRQPSWENFEFLEQLYGVIPGSAEVQANENGNAPFNQETQDNGDNKKKSKSNRALRSGSKHTHLYEGSGKYAPRKQRRAASSSRQLSQRVLRSIEAVDEEIEAGIEVFTEESGWRLLHSSPHGQAHEKHLGEGIVAQVHFLLA